MDRCRRLVCQHDLERALTGKVTAHHRFMLGQQQRNIIYPLHPNRQWLIHLTSVSESLECVQIYANHQCKDVNSWLRYQLLVESNFVSVALDKRRFRVKEEPFVLRDLQELARRRSKMAIIVYQIYTNWLTKRRFKRGKIELESGSTHSRLSLKKSLDYIQEVFDDYLHYSKITFDMLRDKRILEIGPGDNVGVALKFLVAGATQVVCLDKFFSKNDWSHQRKIYELLREPLNENERAIFDEVVDLESGIKRDQKKLSYIYGTGIEEAESLFEPASFDFIVSRAVCEHLYELDAAFSAMDRLLKPGGSMFHKIDFRDHGIFSSYQHHPLTFLTVPDSVYKLMAYDSGKPNRGLIDYYRHKAAELGYDTRILITHIVGIADEVLPHKEVLTLDVDSTRSTTALLDSIRPHLQPEFRNMSDEDLMVSGIFLIMRKH